MPYSKQTWSDNNPTYPLSAARMGVIEQGIYDSAAVADQGHRILSTSAKNALTGVVTGTQVYDTNLGRLETYDGAKWVASTGLVPLVPTSYNVSGGSAVANTASAITFSGATSVSVNGCFGTAYNNHRLVVKLTQSTTGAVYMRMRAAGVDSTGASDYAYSTTSYTTSNTTATGYSGAGSAMDTYGNATGSKFMSMDFYQASEAAMTFMTMSQIIFYSGNSLLPGVGGLLHVPTVAYDGLTFYPGAGTISGTIRVYGYNN